MSVVGRDCYFIAVTGLREVFICLADLLYGMWEGKETPLLNKMWQTLLSLCDTEKMEVDNRWEEVLQRDTGAPTEKVFPGHHQPKL